MDSTLAAMSSGRGTRPGADERGVQELARAVLADDRERARRLAADMIWKQAERDRTRLEPSGSPPAPDERRPR
jgi:hypothetical protein